MATICNDGISYDYKTNRTNVALDITYEYKTKHTATATALANTINERLTIAAMYGVGRLDSRLTKVQKAILAKNKVDHDKYNSRKH